MSVSIENSLPPTKQPLHALLPAYLALGIAIAAALAALCGNFDSSDYAIKVWMAFGIAMVVSFGLHCGSSAMREVCVWLLVALLAALPPAALFMRSASLVPVGVELDGNSLVTIWLGWLLIATLLVAGARTGNQTIPLTAPLVPALSLFGLLNIMSVGAAANPWFLIFVAASIYLAAYERLLQRRVVPGATNEVAEQRFWTVRIALGALVACAVWLVVFVAGATLFYRPVSALLPETLTAALSNTNFPGRKLQGDWRTSPPVMELKGGNYPLSSRAIMRVTIKSGTSPKRWRGNVYEQYHGSQWHEGTLSRPHDTATKSGNFTLLQPTKADRGPSFSPESEQPSPPENLNLNHCPGDSCKAVVEHVEPIQGSLPTVFSSGQPLAVNGNLGELQVRSDGVAYIADMSQRDEDYTIQSQVNSPSLRRLMDAPGLSHPALQAWLDDTDTVDTLDIPDDQTKNAQLHMIARQIDAASKRAHQSLSSPARKAQAVGEYLSATCRYSLSAPVVPEGSDAVLFFLTRSRRGACDMFASSMVLLLRTMNVPARLVTGFLQPEVADDDKGTVYSLRERDAHAWVEYYVPNLGWIAYDPTEGTRTVDEVALNWLDPRDWPAILSKAFVPLSGVLLLGMAAFTFFARERRGGAFTEDTDRERALIAAWYGEATRLLHKRVPQLAHYTAREYEGAVMYSSLPYAAKIEFAALTYLFTQSQYGTPHENTDPANARACLSRLRAALKAQKTRAR